MGNSPQAGHRLLNNGEYPCYVWLSKHVALQFGGRKVNLQGNRESTETWSVSYMVGSSTCNFLLTRTQGSTHSPNEKLEISVLDNTCGRVSDMIQVTVERAEAGLLDPSFMANFNHNPNTDHAAIPQFSFISSNFMSSTNALGGVSETTFHLCDRGTKRGLMVREEKKKSRDEKPYMVTVWYYYAIKPGNLSKADIGLSVAVKRIRVSGDGHLEFALEAPVQHPSAALFYMFDEVIRTGTWKPTYCPHCANEYIQKLRGGSWQSESEDSDGLPAPTTLPGRRPINGGGLLDNGGKFRGNNNGNFNVKKLILAPRGR